MKAEDKAKIMETLGTLTKSITKLQEEIKGISSSNNPLRNAKSKAQVRLCHRRRHTRTVDLALQSLYLLVCLVFFCNQVILGCNIFSFVILMGHIAIYLHNTIFLGTEGTAGCRAGPIQENSGWRRHGDVED